MRNCLKVDEGAEAFDIHEAATMKLEYAINTLCTLSASDHFTCLSTKVLASVLGSVRDQIEEGLSLVERFHKLQNSNTSHPNGE